jgi:SAM-dependent methyltransferase
VSLTGTAATRASRTSPYQLNPSRYGCHMLLLDCFPANGSGRRVLDVGCSNGYFASLLADRGFEVTGIEQSTGHAGAFPPGVRLIEHDLERGLPYLEGRFDRIVCADILEHLRDPLALLQELASRLEPGGRLVASLPNSGNLYFRLSVLFGRFPMHDRGLFDRTHLHFFTWAGWRQLFTEAGFSIENVRSTAIPLSIVFHPHLPRPVALTAEWVCFMLARAWRKLFAYQFVITAVPEARQ